VRSQQVEIRRRQRSQQAIKGFKLLVHDALPFRRERGSVSQPLAPGCILASDERNIGKQPVECEPFRMRLSSAIVCRIRAISDWMALDKGADIPRSARQPPGPSLSAPQRLPGAALPRERVRFDQLKRREVITLLGGK
jgi:hypothetical protein